MTKLKLLLIFLLIFSTTLSSCSFGLDGDIEEIEENIQNKDISENISEKKLKNLEKSSEKPSEKVVFENKSNSNNICSDFEGSKKYICLREHYTKRAIKIGFIEICDALKNGKNNSYCKNYFLKNNAIENSDLKICEKISENSIKKECVAIVGDVSREIDKNDKKCDNLNSGSKSAAKNCKSDFLIKKSIEKEDSSFCNKLKGNEKDSCESEVYINMAIAKLDVKICDKIQKNSSKENCKTILNAVLGK